VVFGYKTYIDQARPFIEQADVKSSGMTHELDRAGQALDSALSGVRTAIVSGGDPGIYAMAGVVFELARSRNIRFGDGSNAIRVDVIPGVPALAAAAAILGAPLTHDFACISLSDRLTPWELITKRLDLAAQADLVIVLYNPKSKGRSWQFAEACRIVGRNRSQDAPVGVVTRACRKGQTVNLTTLGQAPEADVDMQTIVIIGNSQSFTYQGHMVTPRGYLEKYGG
jgi:precorrin-3B C17-methyltransferase